MNESDFFSEKLTAEERSLYDRQFRFEGWDQKIIKNSRVLIAGVGGLGCEIAKNLAMVGIGHIDLVDLDIIEHSNLNRQILFIDSEVGTPKAIAAAKKLRQVNPNIIVNGYYTSLERLHPEIYKDADVIVGGLDSMNARFNLNAQCVRFRKPFVDGGTRGYHGHVYTILPFENGCWSCDPIPATETDEMAACTVVGKPRKRVHCVFKGVLFFQEKFDKEPNPKNLQHINFILNYANDLVQKFDFLPLFTQSEVVKLVDRHDPALITINSVIASIQSHETIKILFWQKGNKSLGPPNDKYIVFNGMSMKFYHIEKKRNKECWQCGDDVRRVEVKISQNSPCIEIISSLKRMGYVLDEYMEPILTIMDFDMVKEVDLNTSPIQNGLRNFEFITAAGFETGEVFVTLLIN